MSQFYFLFILFVTMSQSHRHTLHVNGIHDPVFVNTHYVKYIV